MHTIHDKKFVLDCGTAVATTSRIISGFGRSSLRRKPNTTSEELRAAVESTRPARNLEIYLWSRVLLDQRPGGTSPLFIGFPDPTVEDNYNYHLNKDEEFAANLKSDS